jgi:hypothetical protein
LCDSTETSPRPMPSTSKSSDVDLMHTRLLTCCRGVEPLTGDDIAEVVVFAAGRRENVVIADTLVFPSHQVSSSFSQTHVVPLCAKTHSGWRWSYAPQVLNVCQ